MIAAPPSVLDVAALVAERAEAGSQLRRVAGIPSRTAHRWIDHHLGRIQDVDDALKPDVMLRWGR